MHIGKFGNSFFKKKFYFWSNKTVIITGCTGFKGSWLSLVLKRYGATVIGVSLKPKNKKDLFVQANLKKKILYYDCDINNFQKVNKIFQKVKPDIIFHFAAQSLVINSYKKKQETYKTNLIGSVNVIESCNNLNKKNSLLITTTDKVYKNNNKRKTFIETDKLGGSDPYSTSKAALEIICDYYLDIAKKSKFFSLCVARSGNVIGGGDWSENRLFPDIFRSFYNKKVLIVRNPFSTRPWQHVLETLFGYLNLAEYNFKNKKYSGVYNFGPKKNSAISVLSVLKIVKKHMLSLKFSIKKNNLMYESKFLQLNSNKAIKHINFKQVWTLQETIYKTINWYYKSFKKQDAESLCLDDIKSFEKNY